MTTPFGDPEPSDALLNKSVASTRLKTWLQRRLRQLALEQRIQDARALRSEFLVDGLIGVVRALKRIPLGRCSAFPLKNPRLLCIPGVPGRHHGVANAD